jgi:hypothetical protein
VPKVRAPALDPTRERLVVKFHRPTRQLTVRNFREGLGNNGIIRSPFSAKTLLDRIHGLATEALPEETGSNG